MEENTETNNRVLNSLLIVIAFAFVLIVGITLGVSIGKKDAREEISNIKAMRNISETTYSEAVKIKTNQKQTLCLTEALWFEARGENNLGLQAVAEVIYNRTQQQNKSFCEVIEEPWQFSYRNHLEQGERLTLSASENQIIFNKIRAISEKVVKSEFEPVLDKNVLWYTSTEIKPPSWTKALKKYATIGKHVFYSK